MKKYIIIPMAALLVGSAAFAQEETPANFKLYGFIRNYTVVDSREVNGGTGDLFFYMPKDENPNALGDDLNDGWNWKSLALTTRLGVNVSGYRFGETKVSGAVEADFYSLNGTTSASTIAQLRLRQAYVALGWDLRDGDKLTVNVGQTWHPMAADMPHITNLETGAPFNPFNRSPQVMAHYTTGAWTFTGGMLYLSQYLPVDAQASATTSTKSVNPYKYGLPELYLGAAWKNASWYVKAGVDVLDTKPMRLDGEVKAKGLMTAVSPFVFAQYTSRDKMFQLRAKSILAQSGEHMNLLSGYGVSSYDTAKHKYEYTPMQDWASFVSASYGKKWQVLGMLGYMKQLGTTKEVFDGRLWLNTAADTKIQQAVRVTPTLAYNLGKLTLSLEYDCTAAEFGRGERDAHGLFSDSKWILNHRIEQMVKFTF